MIVILIQMDLGCDMALPETLRDTCRIRVVWRYKDGLEMADQIRIWDVW